MDKLFVGLTSKVIKMMKLKDPKWKMEYAFHDNLCVSIHVELGRIKSVCGRWIDSTNPSDLKSTS